MGARLALKSIEFEETVIATALKCKYIELSTNQDFNDEFMNAMMF